VAAAVVGVAAAGAVVGAAGAVVGAAVWPPPQADTSRPAAPLAAPRMVTRRRPRRVIPRVAICPPLLWMGDVTHRGNYRYKTEMQVKYGGPVTLDRPRR